MILAGIALIVASALCLWALGRGIAADIATDSADHVTGGLAVLLPLYACAAAMALGVWLIFESIGWGA